MQKTLPLFVLLFFSFFACTQKDDQIGRINPMDPKSDLYDPPRVIAMYDASVEINDTIVLSARAEGGTGPDYIFVWALDGYQYKDTTQNVLRTTFSSPGLKKIPVRAIDAVGLVSMDTDTAKITVTATPPIVAILPYSEIVALGDSVFLTCTASDANGYISRIEWRVGSTLFDNAAPDTAIAISCTTTGQYTVVVTVYDDDNLTASDTAVFLVKDKPPVLLSPANNAMVDSTTIQLIWQPGLYSSRYSVLLDTTSPPSTVVAEALTDSSFNSRLTLLESTDYYWAVIGYNSRGDADTSASYRFRTRAVLHGTGPSITPPVAYFSTTFNIVTPNLSPQLNFSLSKDNNTPDTSLYIRWQIGSGNAFSEWVKKGATVSFGTVADRIFSSQKSSVLTATFRDTGTYVVTLQVRNKDLLTTSFSDTIICHIWENEPNNSFLLADTIEGNKAYLCEIGYGNDEEDYFVYVAPDNGVFSYRISIQKGSMSSKTSIYTYTRKTKFFDEQNNLLTTVPSTGSFISGSKISTNINVSRGGIYYINVDNADTSSSVYVLETNFQTLSTAGLLGANNTRATAKDLGVTDEVNGFIGAEGTNENWFVVTPDANGYMTITCSNREPLNTANAGLSIAYLDVQNSVLWSSSVKSGENATKQISVSRNVAHYFRVSGNVARYKLTTSFVALGYEDPFEPNNTEDQAKALPLDSTFRVTLGFEGDVKDYYLISAPAKGTLSVTVFNQSQGVSIQHRRTTASWSLVSGNTSNLSAVNLAEPSQVLWQVEHRSTTDLQTCVEYTIRASFTATAAYEVAYDDNGSTGGNVPDAQTKYEGVNISLGYNTGYLQRTGYIFAGWNSAVDGSGTDYAVGASYTANANVTLYAKWTPSKIVAGPSVTDADGNVYTTIVIGTQTWTVENLKTTKYNDGTPIAGPTFTNAQWAGLTTGAYSYYNNDSIANAGKYGALYNWHAVNTGKLAPAGWRVPTDADWTALENYLIANGYNWDGTTSGNKIVKSMATHTDWTSDTTVGAIGNDLSKNNSSGFSALPGGWRGIDGTFSDQSNFGSWWSATEFDASNAYRFALYNNLGAPDRGSRDKIGGRSVRLLRN